MIFIWTLISIKIDATTKSNIQSISGNIINTKCKGIEFVTVRAYCCDSTMISSCISDSLGNFTIPIPNTEIKSPLHLEFTHLEYKRRILTFSCVPSYKINITMSLNNHLLNEVSVKGDWIRHKDGNLIIDVSQIPGSQKFQSDKLLRQLPGVTKSSDGGYKLNGRPVIFYINGVKQNVTDRSFDAFLSALPASVVSQIQLIEINNGKYPASSDNAVIELKTQKNVVDGCSHQISFSAGTFNHKLYSLSPSYFYMVKKGRWLFYNTMSFDDDNNYSLAEDSTHYEDGSAYTDKIKNGGMYPSIQYNAKLTYTLPNDNQIDLSAFIYDDFGHIHSDISSDSYAKEVNVAKEQKLYKTFENDDLWSGTLSYIIPERKKHFYGTLYYNAVYGGLRSDNDYIESVSNYKYQTSNLRMTGWMHTLVADLCSKYNNFRFEYGINEQCNWMHDNTDYYFLPDSKTSASRFYGRELLTSAYLSTYYDYSKHLTLAGSIRMENTDYKLNLKSENDKDHHNYTNYFPTLLGFFNYKKYNGTFGIVTGISRPKYTSMIPGERKVTEIFYTKGNPELEPSKNFSVIFNNTFFKYLYLKLRYSYFKNVSGEVFYNKDNILYQDYLNYANLENYNISLSLPFRLLKGKLYGQFMGYETYVKYKKFLNDYIPPADRHKAFWLQNYNFTMSYDITDRLNFNADADYSPNHDALYCYTYSSANIDANINYSFLKKKNLILYFDVRNMFDSNDSKQKKYFGNNFRYNGTHRNGPVFTLSVRLKLDKGQKVTEEYRDYTTDVSRIQKN